MPDAAPNVNPAVQFPVAGGSAVQAGPSVPVMNLAQLLEAVKFSPTGNNAPVDSSVPKYSLSDRVGVDPNHPDVNAAFQQGFFPGMAAVGANIFNAPIIKNIVDAISAPLYMSANTVSNLQDRMYAATKAGQDRAAAKGETGDGDFNNRLQTMWEGLNPASFVEDVGSGISKGFQAGLGNKEDAKGYSEIIKKGMEESGMDPNTGNNRFIQGVGGFAGDLLMDPLSYAPPLGISKALTGGVKGFAEGGTSKARDVEKAAEAINAVKGDQDAIKALHDTTGIGRIQGFLNGAKQGFHNQWAENLANTPLGVSKVDDIIDDLKLHPKVSKVADKAEEAINVAKEDFAKTAGANVNLNAAVAQGGENAGQEAGQAGVEKAATKAVRVGEAAVPAEKQAVDTLVAENPQLKEALDKIPVATGTTPESASNAVASETAKPNLADAINGIYGDSGLHAGMSAIHDNIRFVTPAYSPATLNKVKIVEDASKPTTVTEKITRDATPEETAKFKPSETDVVPNSPSAPTKAAKSTPDYAETIKAVKAFDKEMGGVKWPFGKAPNGRNLYHTTEDIVNWLGDKETRADAFSKLDKEHQKFKPGKATKPAVETAPKETKAVPHKITEEVTREIPGTPITPDVLANLGIKPEHTLMNSSDLAKIMKPATTEAQRRDFINKYANDKQVEYIRKALNMPVGSQRTEIAAYFNRLVPKYKEATKLAKDMANGRSIKTDRLQTNIAKGAADNAKLADTLEKNVPMGAADLARKLNAKGWLDEASKGMNLPNTKKTISGQTMQNAVHNIFNDVIHYQSGITRANITPRRYKTDGPDTGAVHPARWETQSAVAEHNAIIREMAKLTDGGQRGISKFDKVAVYSTLAHAVEAQLRSLGIKPFLSLGRQTGESGAIPLSLADIVDILPSDMLMKHLVGNAKGSAIQPTALMTAVENLLRGRKMMDAIKAKEPGIVFTDEDVKKLVTDRVYGALGGYKEAYGPNVRPQTLASITGKGTDHTEVGIKQFIDARAKAAGIPRKEAASNYFADLRSVANKLVNDPDIARNLEQRVVYNNKFHEAEVTAANVSARKSVEEKVVNLAKNPVTAQDWYKGINDAVEEALKTVPPSALDDVSNSLAELRKKFITPNEDKAFSTGKKVAKAKTPEEANSIRPESIPSSEEDAKAALETLNKDYPDEEIKTNDITAGAIATDTLRKIHPFQSFADPTLGFDKSKMFIVVNGGMHSMSRMQSAFHQGLLAHLAKNKNIVDDFKNLQAQVREHVASGKQEAFMPQTEATSDLYRTMNSIWDEGTANSFLTRTGVSAEYFTQVAKDKGLISYIKPDGQESALDLARLWTKAENLNSSQAVLDFLSRSFSTALRISNDTSVAAHFAKTFGSKVAKPGYQKISWSRRAKASTTNKPNKAMEAKLGFFDLLPKDLYYEKNAAFEIPNIHRVMNEARGLSSSTPFGKFINEVFNPLTGALKSTQTTLRPGHWVSNLLGDTIRNHLAGVNSVVPYMQNFRVMKALGHDMSAFGDPITQFMRAKQINKGDYSFKSAINDKEGNLTFRIGGKNVSIPVTQIGRMMEDKIYLPGHLGGIHEDYAGDVNLTTKFAQAVTHATQKVVENPKFNLNKYSAMRDNFTRGALALDVARKGNWRNLQEMQQAMEKAVRKWAPTSMDFTARESKYVRPLLLYYTWLRGMVPNIIETAMDRPGTALVGNKALYNLAVANGVDPVSIGNPFPLSEQFPSYYYENIIGPQVRTEGGALWGFSPMSPFIDVMDTLGSGVTLSGLMNGKSEMAMGQHLIGMANPLIKMPIEMATGQSDGIPIKDNMQYAQDQLSGSIGNLISKSTGKELYNPSLGRTDSSNMHDPALQQQEANLQLANFLSGLKFTNYNSAAAQRSVMGEAKAARTQSRADNRRNQ